MTLNKSFVNIILYSFSDELHNFMCITICTNVSVITQTIISVKVKINT